MAGRFNIREVEDLLVKCHRRCCICHRFCGAKVEIDHIIQAIDGGSNDIENAIPVCFECHAEIHSYNDKHPRGRKFRSQELRKHKDQWLRVCKERPEIFINAPRNSDVGPLQALIDELEFNTKVSEIKSVKEVGCLFQEQQFHRAIQEGAIAILHDKLQSSILDAYVNISTANQYISAVVFQKYGSNAGNTALNLALDRIIKAKPKIRKAKSALLEFLGSEK